MYIKDKIFDVVAPFSISELNSSIVSWLTWPMPLDNCATYNNLSLNNFSTRNGTRNLDFDTNCWIEHLSHTKSYN